MPVAPDKISGFDGSLSPSHVSFKNLIKIPELQNLLEVNYAATRMPSGIIDVETGEVYAGAGWQEICVNFHRVHPECLANCIKSDTTIVSRIKSGEPFGYKCANGLWDIGVPICCQGIHIATYFLGQFHYTDEYVDIEFFAKQAEKYGFDKNAYLEALDKVPRFSRTKVQEILKYNVALASFLSDMASQNLAQRQELALRTQTEFQLHRMQAFLSNIINSMPSMLIGVDAEGVVTFWNHRAEKVTGIAEQSAFGASLEALLPQMREDMERVRLAIDTKKKQEIPKRAHHVDGQLCYDDVTIFPLITDGVEGAVIRIDDITDRVNLEQLMIQSEKMMSVGGLAAGMAHEVNNPLAAILSCRQNIERRIFQDIPSNITAAEEADVSLEGMRRYMRQRNIPILLDMIRDAGERAAGIVNNTLRFTRKSEKNFGMHDLSALLDATLDLAASDYDLKKQYDFKKIDIVREYDPHPVPAFCEPTEIQQVFLNIFRNGAEAMAGKKYPDQKPRFTLGTCNSGGMAIVTIEDNGPGMDALIRKRVFEPFFTTKAVGKGTGLGLSVSYFIITDQHNGRMEVSSEPGQWTRFTISVPAKESEVAD